MRLGIVLLACVALGYGQIEASPKYERRAAWIATMLNLDWPRSLDPALQQAQLRQILDRLRLVGINTVFFQVRAEADAFYASRYEPWSYYLSGQQGRAPEPYYDPLAFAIAEAHRRGMQLHAWVNPFRAERAINSYPLDGHHIARRRPDWTLAIRGTRWLDPGLPEVRTYVVRVITDIARRYDIDGVHLDDYFYPYPPHVITTEDDRSFALHARGHTDRAAWRRENIALFLAELRDSLRSVKPWLPLGISPFGIWKSGVPEGIVGLDAYHVLYADPLDWLKRGLVDYLIPQLYWPIGGPQDFARLAQWWAEVSRPYGRHLYIGHGLYRGDPNTHNGPLLEPEEFLRQVTLVRLLAGAQGSAWFRASNLVHYSRQGAAEALRRGPYRLPALAPPMPWRDSLPPEAPRALHLAFPSGPGVVLNWEEPACAPDGEKARSYAVYRFRARAPASETDLRPEALLGVTGQLMWQDLPPPAEEPYYYVVTALDRVGHESRMSPPVPVWMPIPLAAESLLRPSSAPAPRVPGRVSVALSRPQQVRATIYDPLGRPVRVLIEGTWSAGSHEWLWDGRDGRGQPVPNGTYVCILQTGARRWARLMGLFW